MKWRCHCGLCNTSHCILYGMWSDYTSEFLDRFIIFLPTFLFCFFFFWLHHTACRILYPQPDMEPRSPEVEAWSPNYWTTKEFSYFLTFLFQIYNWLSKILWIFFYNLKYKLQKVHKRDSLTLTYCNITRKNGNNSVVPTLGYKLWICTQNTTQPLTTIMENNWRMKGRQII